MVGRRRLLHGPFMTAPHPSEAPLEILRRAEAARTRGERKAAIALYRRAIESGPPDPAEWHVRLGAVLYEDGQGGEAMRSWRRAIELDPHRVAAYICLGSALRRHGQWEAAIRVFKDAVAANPQAARCYGFLVPLLRDAGRPEEALEACRALLALRPDAPNVLAEYASLLEIAGNVDLAHETILPVVRRDDPPIPALVYFARICQRSGKSLETARALLEKALARRALADRERAVVLHALAGVCDQLDRCDDAFAYLQQAKALHAARVEDRSHELLSVIERSIACYTGERMARLPRARHGSEKPVFIVGMPRSGTSLAEQILASHPQVHGAGELKIMIGIARSGFGTNLPYPECLERLTQERVDMLAGFYLEQIDRIAPGAARVTDKMPFNFLHLGQIEILFPRARVIHCIRDPLDTCVSCYFLNFSPKLSIFRNLTTLGTYYRGYARLMKHWEAVLRLPVFQLRYEELLADPGRVIPAVLDFCGLPPHEACLRFHESKRYTHTFSYHQVRQPLYTRSVGRYRRYERHLAPLLAALGEVCGTPPRSS